MRTCSVKNCKNPVWGTDKLTRKGYCKYHQYKRTDKKTNSKKKTSTGELDLFMQISTERDFKSFISGIDLNSVHAKFQLNCFAHVIPKKGHNELNFLNTKQRNKHLRLNKENIVLLTPREHKLYDQGTESERTDYKREIKKIYGLEVDWNKLYALKEKLIQHLKNTI